MLYIYQDRTIRIEWAIFKGTSQVREDFSRSLVKLFLIGPNEKHLIDATAFDGKLCAELPQGLPEGEYSIETIYVKNQGNLTPRRMPLTPSNATECHHHHSPYPPHDMRFNDRCIMRSRIDAAFSITKYKDEDNTGGSELMKFRSSVASYGYDGLSAYEIAVMRGDFNGSEGEWLDSLGSIASSIGKIADNEDLSFYEDPNKDRNRVLKLKDKEYHPESFSGMGRKYLRKHIVDGKNVLTQEMMSAANTRYIIQYDYDLNGETISIPEGCTLDFQGGSFDNGVLNGNHTTIESPIVQIFGYSLVLSGIFSGTGYVEYYGCYPNNQNNDVCLAIKTLYKGFASIHLQDGTYYTNTGHCSVTNLRGSSKYTTSIIYTASNDNDYLFDMGDMDNLIGANYRKRYLSLSDMQIVMKSQNDTKLYGCSVIKFGNIADSYLRHMMISCYQKGLVSSRDELKSTIEDESLEESFSSVLRFTGYSEILSFDDLRIIGTVPVKSDYSSQLDATNFQNCIFIGGDTGYANVLLKGSMYNVSFTGFCSFNQFVYGIKCTKSVWNLSISNARFEQSLILNDDDGKQLSCNIFINPKDYRIRLGVSDVHLVGESNGIYLDGTFIEANFSNVYTFTETFGSNSLVHLQYALQIGSVNRLGLITTQNVCLPTSDIILKDWGIISNSVINFYGGEYRAIHSIRNAVICNQVYNNVQNRGFTPYDNNRILTKYRHTTVLKAGAVYTVNELSPTSWKLGISTAKCKGVAVIKDGEGNNVKSLGFSFLIDKNADHHFLYKSENIDPNYNIRFGEEDPTGQRLVIAISQYNNKWNVSFMSAFDEYYNPDYTIEIFFKISLYSSYTAWLIQDVEYN